MKDFNLSKKDIINRIGYFRNKKNMTAYELGLMLGHSKTYMYRVESGEIQLSVDTLLDILTILEVTTAEFFCPFIQNEALEIFNNINKLSEGNKQTILDLISKLK